MNKQKVLTRGRTDHSSTENTTNKQSWLLLICSFKFRSAFSHCLPSQQLPSSFSPCSYDPDLWT